MVGVGRAKQGQVGTLRPRSKTRHLLTRLHTQSVSIRGSRRNCFNGESIATTKCPTQLGYCCTRMDSSQSERIPSQIDEKRHTRSCRVYDRGFSSKHQCMSCNETGHITSRCFGRVSSLIACFPGTTISAFCRPFSCSNAPTVEATPSALSNVDALWTKTCTRMSDFIPWA